MLPNIGSQNRIGIQYWFGTTQFPDHSKTKDSIDWNNLELKIEGYDGIGFKGYFSEKRGGSKMAGSLTGLELSNRFQGKDAHASVLLFFYPSNNENQALFKVSLYYKAKLQGEPIYLAFENKKP